MHAIRTREEDNAWKSPPPHHIEIEYQHKTSSVGPPGALPENDESLWKSLSPLFIDNKKGSKQQQKQEKNSPFQQVNGFVKKEKKNVQMDFQ